MVSKPPSILKNYWGSQRTFFLCRLSLLKFTILEIKTEQPKIFTYENWKATICSWHFRINNIYLVKNCYFFENRNLEEEWHVWHFGRSLSFFKKFFWCRPFFFFKSLLNLLQYFFCFMLRFFGPKACGILAPWPGIEPVPPSLEGGVLTTGPPGKSQISLFSGWSGRRLDSHICFCIQSVLMCCFGWSRWRKIWPHTDR